MKYINEQYIESFTNGQAHIKTRKVPKSKYVKLIFKEKIKRLLKSLKANK